MAQNNLGHDLELGNIVIDIDDNFDDLILVGFVHQVEVDEVSVQWVAEVESNMVTGIRQDYPPQKVSPELLIRPKLPLSKKITSLLESAMFDK